MKTRRSQDLFSLPTNHLKIRERAEAPWRVCGMLVIGVLHNPVFSHFPLTIWGKHC